MSTFFHVHDRQGRPPAGDWPPEHAHGGMPMDHMDDMADHDMS